MLLGQAPWVVQWLTPIWILSIGVTLGLIGLVALGGIFWLLSRIPVIGELGTDRNRRTRATWIGTAIAAPIYLAIVYPIVSKAWGVADKGPNVLIGCLLLAPLCYMIPRSLVMLVTRRNVREFPETLREGALWPILWVALGFTLFTGLGITVVRNPGEYLKALQRWTTLSTITKTYRIEPRPAEAIGDTYQEIQISFRRNELASMSFQSTENVEVRSRPVDEDLTLNSRVIDITSRSREQWTPNPMALRQIFAAETIDTLYVLNRGSTAADLSVSVELRPAIPEIVIIPFAAGSVMAVFLLYFVQRATMPRLSAVALATLKSELAQPLFLIVIILGVVSLVAFIVVPGNTFGEDIKILKDSGLTLIKILAMFQAIWAASVSVSEEIEGRTALTSLVYSREIPRHQLDRRVGFHHPRQRIPADGRLQTDLRRAGRIHRRSDLAVVLLGNDARDPRVGVVVHGNPGARGHQRCHFDTPADDGQLHDLLHHLRARQSRSHAGADLGDPVSHRAILRPVDCDHLSQS
jgi:hypothetical protein